MSAKLKPVPKDFLVRSGGDTTFDDLAKHYGVCRPVVSRWCRLTGRGHGRGKHHNKPNRRHDMAPELLLARLADGATQAGLAREFGVSRNRIHQRVKAARRELVENEKGP